MRSTLTDALLASLAKARFLYWERFAHLEDSETVSRQVKEARIKVGADTLECFRLEVKPAKDQFEISTGAKETLWIEVRSGIVVRSDIQQIQGGMPISRSTLWSVVDPKLPSEEMVTLTKPLDSLDTDQPALPGK